MVHDLVPLRAPIPETQSARGLDRSNHQTKGGKLTIYVDPPTRYPAEAMKDAQTRRNGPLWSHMWTDGEPEELIDFAVNTLGLKAKWFQDRPRFGHFDIVPTKRDLAIRHGAVEITLRKYIVWKRMLDRNNERGT